MLIRRRSLKKMSLSSCCSFTPIILLLSTFNFLLFLHLISPFLDNPLFYPYYNADNSTHKSSWSSPSLFLSFHHNQYFSVSKLKFISGANNNMTHSLKIKKYNRLERIEEDLARGRASIRGAVQSKNYELKKVQSKNYELKKLQHDDDFMPRGSIYRNPYAFYQSHKEMVRRLKVWTYSEGERPLVHMGPSQDLYCSEGHFISEMESKNSPFRAQRPEEAHLFFLPISIANVVKYIYTPVLRPSDYSRDRLHRFFTDYVNTISTKYPYWNASNGADHFFTSCHDWAPDVSGADRVRFNKFIRVLCNANMSEGFKPTRDVTLPELFLSYGQLDPLDLGQDINNRTILAFFSGGNHGHIRKFLFEHWKDKDDEVQVHEKTLMGQNCTKMMGQSRFCLCPSGYEVASPRVVESILQGCVPVILSDNYSLPFTDVLDWSQFSIQIPVEKIPEIKSILKSVKMTEYLRLYKRVKRVRRYFEMNRPAKPFDVIHMIFHSLWLRRLNFRLSI